MLTVFASDGSVFWIIPQGAQGTRRWLVIVVVICAVGLLLKHQHRLSMQGETSKVLTF